MTRELFVETIGEMKKQMQHDVKCSKAFSVILEDDWISTYNNTFLWNQLLRILKLAMDDSHKDSWIEYFIWELDFGKHYRDGCVSNTDGSVINIKTSGALWDFLKELKQ